jgi:hypothetical protein
VPEHSEALLLGREGRFLECLPARVVIKRGRVVLERDVA